MPRTAAGGVLLGPEPPNAAGGIPGGGLRMIARLDGADLRPNLFLVYAPRFNQQAKALLTT